MELDNVAAPDMPGFGALQIVALMAARMSGSDPAKDIRWVTDPSGKPIERVSRLTGSLSVRIVLSELPSVAREISAAEAADPTVLDDQLLHEMPQQLLIALPSYPIPARTHLKN